MQPLAEHIWVNGELTPWADAKVHVMSHALHYGTSVFEGIRVYDTPDGPCGFRLTDHVRRLFDSARMYHFELPYTVDELVEACRATVRSTGLKSAYIRPIAFLGACGMGVTPSPENMNVDVAIAAFPWGAYLGEEALEKGVDACVASWSRIAPNTVPSGAKAGGNYLSSYLIGREALSVADECFMTGTAAEITPVRSVDGITTRAAGPGPVTRAVNAAFRGLFTGATPDRHNWLEPIGALAETRTREAEYA